MVLNYLPSASLRSSGLITGTSLAFGGACILSNTSCGNVSAT